MAIPSALVTSVAVDETSIDQPTIRRENTSSTARAVHFALLRRVLGDVGHPETVAFAPVELSVDEITGRRHVRAAAVARTPRQALQAGAPHQHLHHLVTDSYLVSELELGVDSPGTVHATRVDVNLSDDLEQPRLEVKQVNIVPMFAIFSEYRYTFYPGFNLTDRHTTYSTDIDTHGLLVGGSLRF